MSKSSLRAPAYTFTRAQKTVAIAAMVAIALLFRDTFGFLYASWQRDEYSHCALIPLLSGFLLWQRWTEIRRRLFAIMPAGLLVVLAGLLIDLAGAYADSKPVEAYALILVFSGCLLTLMGWNAFRRALGPVALLLLMVPLPDFVHARISPLLQDWSLGLAAGMLRLLGVSVLLDGTMLDFGARQLRLADASGLSLLLPLFSLGTIMAFFVGGRLWVRVVIVLSTIPIAILMNGVHIGMLGMQQLQSGGAYTLLHLVEGWAIFMACLFMLLAEIWLLLLLSGDSRRLREALAIDWPEAAGRESADRRSRPRTRLLVVTSNFAPEITGIGKYVGEMTAWMFKAGFEIRVVTAPPYYPAWRVADGYSSRKYSRERLAGALVYRCPLHVPRRPGGISRMLHTISFSISTLPVILWQAFSWRPQVVFVVEPPLTCAPAAILCARICGAQAWLHVQDFEVDAAFDLGLLRNERLRRFAFGAEQWLMRRFDRVSSISGAMLKKLEDKGVDPGRIAFFPNWVDTNLIRPLAGTNRLRAELGIDADTTVLLYSGNMGEKQGLNLIVDVARSFAGSEKILFLLCGDGAAKWRTMQAAAGFRNVRFISLQPLEKLNELLNLADVHLLPQRAEAEDLVMPSKLTAIMASGRPVVASARPGSDVARAAAAGGLVVAPGDSEAFGTAIRALLSDDRLRADLGNAGRVYAASNWDRETVLRAMMSELEASIAIPAQTQPAMVATAGSAIARSTPRK
jgi:colanic acid biosynthesis glycosyl transferase WcaI